MNSRSPVVETTSAYIPMDRRRALARGEALPDRVEGAALFADISGFTPLTEALVRELGPQRGAEELTHHLNQVYDALINDLHAYGGSVISFSGDAITCWFGQDSGLIALQCALAMQQTMQQFSQVSIPSGKTVSLAMKAAVAAGSARRFVVGDLNIQRMDVLAGATLDRLAAAEHQAKKGEVVLDGATAAAASQQVRFVAWRVDEETGEKFAVVAGLIDEVEPAPRIMEAPVELTEVETRPWLLPPVYERLRANQGEFLAELRPAVALFLRFGGIDYDGDEAAGHKLDTFMRWVQQVLARYDVYPLQLTVGDKGSYLYSAFGAPIAHEDDAVRAISAALELRNPPATLNFIQGVQIGISQGRMRTGAYGGQRRRTYGVLGDDVNLAARLMQAAQPGQVLVSEPVQWATGDLFNWDLLPPLTVKGKTEPITVFSAIGRTARQTHHLQAQDYALPMVGRRSELSLIEEQMQQTLQGQGKVIGITGPAGSGKTRLIAELIKRAGQNNLAGFGGECPSYGTNISYLAWQSVWRGIFNIGPSDPVEAQISALTDQLGQINPALIQRLPLLGALLNITIPDNDLTAAFDAKLRKTSLESLLVDCLRAKANQAPLLIVLEDAQWLDPLSLDLLEVLGLTIAELPVLLIVAYRPPELQNLRPPWAMLLPNFTEIPLVDFNREEAETLIHLKLAQVLGDEVKIPQNLVERIMRRAQGNPFYIDELLNYLQDKAIDPRDISAVEQLDLPASLHSLILSRIDQLSESQKTTLKVASVIGRLFKEGYLWATYPQIGDPGPVRADLETLTQLDLTALDTSEPELTYFFKHIITQEVAYESLPYATRALLHEHLAWFLERAHQDTLDQYVDLLAFHFSRTENDDKKREYFRKAGEEAQAEYANEAAIDYYRRLLPLLTTQEKVPVLRNLADVLQLVGQWDEAADMYEQALSLAQETGEKLIAAWCRASMGDLLRKQGQYSDAWHWLTQARAGFETLGEQAGAAQVFHTGGTLAAMQGDFETARDRYRQGLEIRRGLHDEKGIANLLTNLGIIAHRQGNYQEARILYEEGLDLARRLGDKWTIGVTLINLGYVALDQDDYAQARTWLDEAVSLHREVGDRAMTANALNNLANVARAQADYAAAQSMYEESLNISWALGDKVAIAYLLEDIGCLLALQGPSRSALRLVGAARSLRESIGAPLPPPEQTKLDQILLTAREALGEEASTEAESQGREMTVEEAVQFALRGE